MLLHYVARQIRVAQWSDQEIRLADSQRRQQVLISAVEDGNAVFRTFEGELDERLRDEEGVLRHRAGTDDGPTVLDTVQRGDFRACLLELGERDADPARE